MAPKAVLVGLPGSGKSTIGRRLAKALGVGFLDTDAAIEQQTGRRITEIFATDAVALLHEATAGAMREIDRLAASSLREAARKKRRLVERDSVARAIEADARDRAA